MNFISTVFFLWKEPMAIEKQFLPDFLWFCLFESYFQGVKSAKNVFFLQFFADVSTFLHISDFLLKLEELGVASICASFYDIKMCFTPWK